MILPPWSFTFLCSNVSRLLMLKISVVQPRLWNDLFEWRPSLSLRLHVVVKSFPLSVFLHCAVVISFLFNVLKCVKVLNRLLADSLSCYVIW